MNESEFTIIFEYTRQNALDDGVLVDISDTAKGMGYKVPVAMSANLYLKWIVPSEKLEAHGQSTEGRLRDVLFLNYAAAIKNDSSRVTYQCRFLVDGDGPKFETVDIVAAIEFDPNLGPCITIFLPEDD